MLCREPVCYTVKLQPAGGNNSVVECDLAKVEVAGSNPVSRSIRLLLRLPSAKRELRSWQANAGRMSSASGWAAAGEQTRVEGQPALQSSAVLIGAVAKW